MTLEEFIRQNGPTPEARERATRRAQGFKIPLTMDADEANRRMGQLMGAPEEPPSVGETLSTATPASSIQTMLRDVVTPGLTKAVTALVPPGAAHDPSRAIWGEIVKGVVPQDEIDLGILAFTGAGGAAGRVLKPTSKLLMPLLGRLTGSTAGGAIGGAVMGGEEGATEGVARGLIGGLTGEALGYAPGFAMRRGPGGTKRVTGRQVERVLQAAGETAEPLRNLPSITNPRNAYQVYTSAAEGEMRNRLSGMMDEVMGTIDRRLRGQLVSVPALGPDPLPVRQAWEQLSLLGQAGYRGQGATVAGRTLTGQEARKLWAEGIDQLGNGIFRGDPSGVSVGLFNEGRRVYSSGHVYSDLFRNPAIVQPAPGTGGQRVFNREAAQEVVHRQRGRLRSRDAEGQPYAGKMAKGEREYVDVREVPGERPPIPPAEALPPAPGETALALPSGETGLMPLNALEVRGARYAEPQVSTPAPLLAPVEEVSVHSQMPYDDLVRLENALTGGRGLEYKDVTKTIPIVGHLPFLRTFVPEWKSYAGPLDYAIPNKIQGLLDYLIQRQVPSTQE